MPLQELEPFVEASSPTSGEFLEEFFPGRDIAADLKRVQTFLESLESFVNRILAVVEPVAIEVCEAVARLDKTVVQSMVIQIFEVVERFATTIFEPVLVPVCEMHEQLEKLPPAPYYEPVLIELGQHPLMARGLAHGIIRAGKDEANNARMQRIVVDGLRYLAKPGRTPRSISRKAAILLEEWNTTSSNLSDVFYGVDFSVFEFVATLEGAVRGDFAAFQRAREIAAALAPGLSARRGPKASAASLAHELLLTYLGNKAYTYDPVVGDYTDALTDSTRSAFGEPDFDPSPARRRQKKRRLRSR